MSDLIFGTDLDDCILLTSKAILNSLEEELNIKINFEDLNIYAFENVVPKESYNIVIDVVRCVLENTNEIESVKNAIAILNWISTLCKDEKIFVLSHRPFYLYQHTKEVLENIGLKNFELIFNYDDGICDFIHKYKAIEKCNIDIFVEDRPSTIYEIYENTSSTVLVMDKPWTRNISENNRIFIVNNWMEIRDYFLTFNSRRKCYGL